jgi:hypothetical protein
MELYPITARPGKTSRTTTRTAEGREEYTSRQGDSAYGERQLYAAVLGRALDDLTWDDEREDALEWLESKIPEEENDRISFHWCLRVLELQEEVVIRHAQELLAAAEEIAKRRRDNQMRDEKLNEIISSICYEHGITVEQLKSNGQKRKIVNARKEIVFQLVKLGLTYEDAGIAIGRDRSTAAWYGMRARTAMAAGKRA